MNLRPTKTSDTEAIKQLVFAVLDEYGLAPDPETTDRDLDDIDACYTQNQGYFGVVEVGRRIVASVGIYRIDNRTCELRKMYAAADQRGKGLGKQLLTFAFSKAIELGYQRMILETATPLVEAIALYRRYGFREYQPQHLSCRCDQAFERSLLEPETR